MRREEVAKGSLQLHHTPPPVLDGCSLRCHARGGRERCRDLTEKDVDGGLGTPAPRGPAAEARGPSYPQQRSSSPQHPVFAAGPAGADPQPHPVPRADFTSASRAQHAPEPAGAGPPQHAPGEASVSVGDAGCPGAPGVVACVRVAFVMSSCKCGEVAFALHFRRRQAPRPDAAGRLATGRAGPVAAGGRRRNVLARRATPVGRADVEIRHAAAPVDVDLAAAEKHGLELLACALHA